MPIIRHGDVLLIPAQLPVSAKKVKSVTSFVLAEGETTGHRHVLTAEPTQLIDIYEDGGKTYIVPHGMGTLTHQEHGTLTVLPGTYVLGAEREKDHFLNVIRL